MASKFLALLVAQGVLASPSDFLGQRGTATKSPKLNDIGSDTCGMSRVSFEGRRLIANGKDAQGGEIPWMVSLGPTNPKWNTDKCKDPNRLKQFRALSANVYVYIDSSCTHIATRADLPDGLENPLLVSDFIQGYESDGYVKVERIQGKHFEKTCYLKSTDVIEQVDDCTEFFHSCGGALIQPLQKGTARWIAAAAHCMDDINYLEDIKFNEDGSLNVPELGAAMMGSVRNPAKEANYDMQKSRKIALIKKVWIMTHEVGGELRPLLKWPPSNQADFDYVLYMLDEGVVPNEDINVLCTYQDQPPLLEGTDCVLSGFGKNDDAKQTFPQTLQIGQFKIVSDNVCNMSYKACHTCAQMPSHITPRQICANGTTLPGNPAPSVAGHRDSGSPLACPTGHVSPTGEKQFALVGTVTGGQDSDPSTPSGRLEPSWKDGWIPVPGFYARWTDPDVQAWMKSTIDKANLAEDEAVGKGGRVGKGRY